MGVPPSGMQELLRRLKELPFFDSNAESLQRLVARSTKVTADKVGRIRLPEQLAKAANLGKEVVLKGLLFRFQIWNPEYYDQVKAKDLDRRDESQKLV
jgi:MraZ protein